MFKLGDYDEEDALVIAEFLREAEIKVELKPAIDVIMRSSRYIEGKFGELKDKVEDIEIYELYLESLRMVFPECENSDDLFERMGAAQDPNWQANRDELKQLAALEAELLSEPDLSEADDDLIIDEEDSPDLDFGDTISEKERIHEQDTIPDRISDGILSPVDSAQVAESDRIGSLNDDVAGAEDETDSIYERRKKLHERRNELIESFAKNSLGYIFALRTLEMNKIEFGEDLGSRLDDPVVRIMATNDNKLTADPDSIKALELFEFSKTIAVYIDEFSAAMADDLDDAFKDEYEREYARVAAIRIFTRDLIFDHPRGKIDMETFIEMCEWQSDEEWGILYIDGSMIAEDVSKVLEKNGIVKIKGERIKWKNIGT